MTAHACACCPLRFASNGELADHVRSEHSEATTPGRDTLRVVRQHFPPGRAEAAPPAR